MDMEIITPQWDDKVTAEERQAVEATVASAQTLPSLISGWLTSMSRSIELLTGYDDDNIHTLLAVIFKDGAQDLATIYFPLAALKKLYPDILPLSSYIIGKEHGGHLKLNGGLLEKRAEEMGLVFHDDLVSDLGPLEGAVRYALMYGMDDIGSASFELADMDEITDGEELEDKSLLAKKIGRCYMHYFTPEMRHGMRPGTMHQCYFVLE